MKKLLSLLATMSLTVTTVNSVVACNNKEENDKNYDFGTINGFNGEIHRIISDKKNKLYVGTKIKNPDDHHDLRGKLYSVDLKDDNKVTEITGIEGSVYNLSIWNDKLYVGTKKLDRKGFLYSIDLKDNNKVTEITGIEGEIHNLFIWNDKLYVGTKTGHDQGKLYSVDLKDNNKITEITGIKGEVDALIVLDNKLYVGTVANYIANEGNFYSVELENNNKVTEIKNIVLKGTIFSFAIYNKLLYIGTTEKNDGSGSLYSVDLENNNKVTEITGIKGEVYRLIIQKNKLYVGTKTGQEQGKLYSVDLENNNKVTEIDNISNFNVYGLAAIDDYIYIGISSHNSNIYWFK